MQKTAMIKNKISNSTDSNDRIETVTGQTFDALVLEKKGPVAVEFMSYGCTHCQTLEPVLQKVAEMVALKEKIVRVNVEIDPELADLYQIQATPTLIMFLNGRPVGQMDGPHPTVSAVLTAVTQPFNP